MGSFYLFVSLFSFRFWPHRSQRARSHITIFVQPLTQQQQRPFASSSLLSSLLSQMRSDIKSMFCSRNISFKVNSNCVIQFENFKEKTIRVSYFGRDFRSKYDFNSFVRSFVVFLSSSFSIICFRKKNTFFHGVFFIFEPI